MKKILLNLAALTGIQFVSGCGTLPRSGPSASAMLQNQYVDVIKVTPSLALSLLTQLQIQERDDVAQALRALQNSAVNPNLVLAPGDQLSITMWSFSSSTGQTSGLELPNGPVPSQLGQFVVAANGDISLPYIGNVDLAGLDLIRAQSLIAQQYAAMKIVEDPSVTIDPTSVPQGSVTVTGSVGDPKIIPWTPAGITLANAITQALGNGTDIFSPGPDPAIGKSAIEVEVVRGTEAPVKLPLTAAMENTVALQPNDTIIVTKTPAVEVTVIGAGVKNNGMFGYAGPPVLSEVLAEANGLDGYVADDRAIFVMRRRPQQTPFLYDFAWNDINGMVAAQEFPILNGDIIYVAEAPIVPIEQVISTLFEIAVPAQVFK